MPYWLWIGNNPSQFNPTPLDNLTPEEAGSIVGHTAAGPAEIAPVFVEGEILGSNFQTTFNSNFQGGTQMNYTDPDGNPVADGRMTTVVSAQFRVYDIDTEGNQFVVGTYTGLFVQMNNGDMFFRPQAGYVDEWSEITRIYSVEVMSTTVIADNSAINPVIGFNPDIVDLQIVPCFTRGTQIDTDRGEVAVEDLMVGDLIRTLDNDLRPVRWIGSRFLAARSLDASPNLRPVRIRAGALGGGTPSADLIVSPQHRVLVRSNIALRMFGTDEVLVAAKQLLTIDGIDIAEDLAEVEYFHLLFDQHQVIYSNGAATESLFVGPMARAGIGKAAQQEIDAIFPELSEVDYQPVPARHIPAGREARHMAGRHTKNNKPLVTT